MIQRLETLYYQCLRHIEQDLAPFHMLVGANGSGKTTFLDAIAFLGDFVRDGLDAAIYDRANDLRDLTCTVLQIDLKLLLNCLCLHLNPICFQSGIFAVSIRSRYWRDRRKW